jgi:hypothetical protein
MHGRLLAAARSALLILHGLGQHCTAGAACHTARQLLAERRWCLCCRQHCHTLPSAVLGVACPMACACAAALHSEGLGVVTADVSCFVAPQLSPRWGILWLA